MASHFFRASNVTIGLDLMRDLAIGPEALGALTGAFFFGFSAMQIPCGFFFDRFGPRLTVAGMLLVATLGGIIFTTALTWPVLLSGRVLLGCRFRRHADRQHGGDLALVSAGSLLDADGASCCRSACSAI